MSATFTPPAPLKTAVLFLVFNRPDTTARVFEAIRQARPPRLYVAADGPRAGREGEAERVVRAREIATAVDWPCEVKTLFREKNLGCKAAVSGAITWFFEQEEQGIILEDDCLPSQSFFWFCESMLERYEDNLRVMSICGTNINRKIKLTDDYFFSIYALMWGWATWRRSWKLYDKELNNWPEKQIDKTILERNYFTTIELQTWTEILSRTYSNKIDTWDYQWIYSCWINDGLTVSPRLNLIRNLGFSVDATHTFGPDPVRSNLVPVEQNFPLKHPEKISSNREADRYISKYWFHASQGRNLKRQVLNLPGMMALNNLINKIVR